MKTITKIVVFIILICATFATGSMLVNYKLTGKFAVPKYDIHVFVTPNEMSLNEELERKNEELERKIKFYQELAVQAAVEIINLAAGEARKKFKRKYDTTAAWQLDMEADAYPLIKQSDYDLIDDTIDFVKKKIAEDKHFSHSTGTHKASLVFEAINEKLKKYRKNTDGNGEFLLSRGIRSKKLDCDLNSVIYLSVGEALHLPIQTVRIPNTQFNNGHVLVMWKFWDEPDREEDEWVFWEATSGKFTSREELKEWLCPKSEIKYVFQNSQQHRENWKGQLQLEYLRVAVVADSYIDYSKAKAKL